MTEAIIEFFREIIKNDYLTIIIIAMLPIVELRGAIPVALGMEMPPIVALAVAYLGTSLVVPFLFLLLRPILNVLKKIKFIDKIALAMEQIFQAKADKVINSAKAKGRMINGEISTKYKVLGVLVFVAVPLPMTGVWTGSAIAAFLNIKFMPAMFAVLLGNLCAGIIMIVLSMFFIDYLDIILNVFLISIIIILLSYVITLVIKSAKNKSQDNK